MGKNKIILEGEQAAKEHWSEVDLSQDVLDATSGDAAGAEFRCTSIANAVGYRDAEHRGLHAAALELD